MALDTAYDRKLEQWRNGQLQKLQGMDQQTQRQYAQQIDQQYTAALSQWQAKMAAQRQVNDAAYDQRAQDSAAQAWAINTGQAFAQPAEQPAEQPQALGLQMGANKYDRAVNAGAERQMQGAERLMLAAYQAGDEDTFARLVSENPVVAKRMGLDVDTSITGTRQNGLGRPSYLAPENVRTGLVALMGRNAPAATGPAPGNKYELAGALVQQGRARDTTEALKLIAQSESSGVDAKGLQAIDEMARQNVAMRMGLNPDGQGGYLLPQNEEGSQARDAFMQAVEQEKQAIRASLGGQPQGGGLRLNSDFAPRGMIVGSDKPLSEWSDEEIMAAFPQSQWPQMGVGPSVPVPQRKPSPPMAQGKGLAMPASLPQEQAQAAPQKPQRPFTQAGEDLSALFDDFLDYMTARNPALMGR